MNADRQEQLREYLYDVCEDATISDFLARVAVATGADQDDLKRVALHATLFHNDPRKRVRAVFTNSARDLLGKYSLPASLRDEAERVLFTQL